MKKLLFLFLGAMFLGGCATYKFHHGQAPYDKGYVVSRDNRTLLEYTIGQEDSVPDRKTAKERFLRRRQTVEYYYKKMGYIDSYFKMAFWDPVTSIFKIAGGVFRLPFIAVSDYRYDHDPAYRERIKKAELDKEAREEERINRIKIKLKEYVQKDLSRETSVASAVKETPVKIQEPEALKTGTAPKPAENPLEQQKEAAQVKEKILKEMSVQEAVKVAPLARQAVSSEPGIAIKAVILAKPIKGLSPLKVSFIGSKSYSQKARIVSYAWDFGDGDTSLKANPANIYYSGSYDPKEFTVTLTVKDNLGRSATSSLKVTVLNQ